MPHFLDGLDRDIRDALIAQLRNLWTHTSTAIEGNTLTLGETAFVIEEGLTISGKPLKDHQEVVGHARAIDLVYDLVRKDAAITEEDLFALHRAVQTESVVDIMRPVGAWKKEPNGTYFVTEEEKQVFIEYAAPEEVPGLMAQWMALLNSSSSETLDQDQALQAYVALHVSFVRIHPFFDGNGRMARLAANLPVLKSGFPPVIIPKEKRREYIRFLAEYEFAVGQAKSGGPLLPERERLKGFTAFCAESWQQSMCLVEQARKEQKKRA